MKIAIPTADYTLSKQARKTTENQRKTPKFRGEILLHIVINLKQKRPGTTPTSFIKPLSIKV
jgi:hypothetical protein